MSGPGRLKKQATSMTLSQIPDIVKDLKAATYEGKEQVTHLMDIVALHQSQNPAALVQGGAIKPLVELLTNGNDGSQIHAASTLATIAAAKYEYQDKIIDAGGVEPLCHLLHQGSNKANCYAAAAVASLADQRKHQERIIKAGACRPLARLVREDVTVDTQWHASDAIADLSVQNPAAQKIFYEAGVVPLLLALLHSGKANTSAAKALAKMLSPAKASSEANAEIQQEIAADGGIPHILALLSGMDARQQMYAAEALSNLARGNMATQTGIAKAGGIGPLLALLGNKITSTQAQAASALAQLAKNHPDNQNSIAENGGIPLLMALLSSAAKEVQEMAALSIAEVCRKNPENQQAAAESGSIVSLVEQLKNNDRGVDDIKAEAVGAIWVLSEDNAANKVAIAAKGGIQPTVGLLAAGTERAQRHAEQALASLGFNNPQNLKEITAFLVSLLSSGTAEAKANATALLERLEHENPDDNTEMAQACPMPDLIGLLKDGTKGAKKFALWSLSLSINPSNQKIMLEEEAVDPVVLALGSMEAITRKQAAAAIKELANNNSKACLAIAAKGGIAPLIHIVKGGGARPASAEEGDAAANAPAGASPPSNKPRFSTEGVESAVATDLAAPAPADAAGDGADASSTDGGGGITGGGGGPAGAGAGGTPGSKVGGGGEAPVDPELFDSMEARRYAAAALADLANLPKNGAIIISLGGIAPLVNLLSEEGGDSARQYASSALGRLAAGDAAMLAKAKKDAEKKDATKEMKAAACKEPASTIIAKAGAIKPLVVLLEGGCGDKAQEEAAGALFELAGDVTNRIAITDAGGIGPLVTLLGSDNSTTQKHAKGVLVRLSIESANRALIIKKLVHMLSESGEGREQAAAAIANLASESADNRVSIVDAGGIEPLLGLLRDTAVTPKAKENSTAAIAQLAESESIQRKIAAAGGIPLLANTLASSSNAKELMQYAQLYSLAANALSKLAKGNGENQASIAQTNAIPSLVAILGAPLPDLQANAAECLGNLSEHNQDNQTAIARTGAIAPLCTLVREGTDERVKEQAAAAICSMAIDNKPNKDTVAKLGGIEPLISLVVTGENKSSLEQATAALASLSSKHAENRETIAKLIVARMLNRNALVQTPGGAERVLSAVSMLCVGSTTNQAVIAKAGGVPPLIQWLSGAGGATAEAQAAAAHALLSMVAGNEALQAMIARSNGIPPLIELVSQGSRATQEAAASLLWHLAGNVESATAISGGGGMQPLCRMLEPRKDSTEDASDGAGGATNDGVRAQELAATVISRLLKSNPSVGEKFDEMNATPALVKMLIGGSPAGQQQATCVLAEASLVHANLEAIFFANGCVESLVGLLTSSVVGTSEIAARVLANLARPPSDDQPAGVTETQLNAQKRASAERRQRILDVGGVKQLIVMLSSISIGSSLVARKIWELTAKVIGANPDDEGLSKKMSLENEVIGVQEQAAATLADLANDDASMQSAIVEALGVPPLLNLVRSGSIIAQEHATRAIYHLCTTPSNQGLIVEAGAVADLVLLSKTGSAASQAYAAAVISELAKGAGEGGEGGENAETAEDRQAAIVAAGGITPLISLLTSGNEKAKERAASALNHLTSSQANRDSVLKAGGIPSLCQLLDDGTARAHEHAVAVLTRLAFENGDAQTMIAKKLVSLLSSDGEVPKRRCAHLLYELGANNEGASVRIVNAGAISPLVAILGTTFAEAKEQAIGALSTLAQSEPSNQLAIAMGLVKLLDLEKSEVEDNVERIMAKFKAAAPNDFKQGLTDVVGIWLNADKDGGEGGGGAGGKGGPLGKSGASPSTKAKAAKAKAKTERDGNSPTKTPKEIFTPSTVPFWKQMKEKKAAAAAAGAPAGANGPGAAPASASSPTKKPGGASSPTKKGAATTRPGALKLGKVGAGAPGGAGAKAQASNRSQRSQRSQRGTKKKKAAPRKSSEGGDLTPAPAAASSLPALTEEELDGEEEGEGEGDEPSSPSPSRMMQVPLSPPPPVSAMIEPIESGRSELLVKLTLEVEPAAVPLAEGEEEEEGAVVVDMMGAMLEAGAIAYLDRNASYSLDLDGAGADAEAEATVAAEAMVAPGEVSLMVEEMVSAAVEEAAVEEVEQQQKGEEEEAAPAPAAAAPALAGAADVEAAAPMADAPSGDSGEGGGGDGSAPSPAMTAAVEPALE